MKKIMLLFIVLAGLMFGCASKQVDPNYQAQLTAYDSNLKSYASLDRTVWAMEVGDQPVTLPPGTRLTVKSQLPEFQPPPMFRDYGQEARLKFWGGILTAFANQGLGGLFSYLGQREDRKLYDGIFAAPRGIDFTATGDINFSGGIGDYGTRGYTSTVTPAPVVIPPVINAPPVP